MGAKNTVTLTEQSDSLGESVTVDRDAGIIRGVKLLGLTSRNNREYVREAVGKAKNLYEGTACNINHRAKPGDSRVCTERFGEFRCVEQRADGCLYGELHYLKSHDMADRVCEAAERKLRTFGMSHDAKGRTSSRNGRTFVEEILSVASVDLVADAATTSGLFESENRDMELQEQVDALKADVLKLNADLTAANAAKATLQEQVDAAKAVADKQARKDAVALLLKEHKIDPAKAPASILALIETQTAEAAKVSVKELAESLRVTAPKSKGDGDRPSNTTTTDGKPAFDAKKYAASLKS